MKLKLEDKSEVDVRFYYIRAIHTIHDPEVTIAKVITPDGATPSVGIARLGPKDHFSKKIGRKIALTRALAEYNNKPFRRMIWEAYGKYTKSF